MLEHGNQELQLASNQGNLGRLAARMTKAGGTF
jgi:hypothetical protein